MYRCSQFVSVLVATLRPSTSCPISCPPRLLAPLLSHDINLSLWFLLFDVTRKTNQTFYSWSMSNAEISSEFKCSSLFLLTPELHSPMCTKPSLSADEPEISRVKRDHRCVHTYLHHDPTIKILTTNIPQEHRQWVFSTCVVCGAGQVKAWVLMWFTKAVLFFDNLN